MKKIIEMKIFIVLCGLLPSFQGAVSLKWENNTYIDHLLKSSEVREVIHNVSSFITQVNRHASQMAMEFHLNVTDLGLNYGSGISDDFNESFERKVAELAVSPVMTEHCQNYFENLLKDHKAYQARLSENITKATYHWNLGLYNLYYKFTIARQLIGTLERKVSDCHSVRLTKNEINSYRCLIGIAQEAEMLKNQIVESIYKHMTSLTEVKDSSLISLHQSINGSLIPPVFDEAAMDKWLALHCPEGS